MAQKGEIEPRGGAESTEKNECLQNDASILDIADRAR